MQHAPLRFQNFLPSSRVQDVSPSTGRTMCRRPPHDGPRREEISTHPAAGQQLRAGWPCRGLALPGCCCCLSWPDRKLAYPATGSAYLISVPVNCSLTFYFWTWTSFTCCCRVNNSKALDMLVQNPNPRP